jgi:TetR/AcrR family transcriptional repressor of nem operon
MARPKEFDPETALDAATEVFRRSGYTAASVEELLEAMGINRASLYDTFGDKRQLYLAALDRYDKLRFDETCAILEAAPSVVEGFRRLFTDTIDRALSPKDHFGCLLTNSAVERAAIDPECAERAMANWRRRELLYFNVFRQARERGELHGTDDTLRATARFLLGVNRGLRVAAKSTGDRETLEDIAGTALTVLDSLCITSDE